MSRIFQAHYLVEEYPALRICSAYPKPNTLLRCTFSRHIAVLFPVSLLCWGISYLFTLQSFSKSFYNADQFLVSIQCWGTPCIVKCWSFSHQKNIAEAYLFLIRCWAITNINTLLKYMPYYYFTELFRFFYSVELVSISLHCCDKHWLVTLLKHSQFQNTAQVHPALFIAYVDPIVLFSLVFSQPWYIAEVHPAFVLAELFPILIHCWFFARFNTMLNYTLRFFAELIRILFHFWGILCLVTFLSFSQS